MRFQAGTRGERGSGRAPFTGNDPAQAVAVALAACPPSSQLPTSTPPAVKPAKRGASAPRGGCRATDVREPVRTFTLTEADAWGQPGGYSSVLPVRVQPQPRSGLVNDSEGDEA